MTGEYKLHCQFLVIHCLRNFFPLLIKSVLFPESSLKSVEIDKDFWHGELFDSRKLMLQNYSEQFNIFYCTGLGIKVVLPSLAKNGIYPGNERVNDIFFSQSASFPFLEYDKPF